MTDMSIRVATSYFDILKSSSNETKLHLIKMLTDSVLKAETKVMPHKEKLEDLFGIWANDSETDRIEAEIRRCRMSSRTRNIASFDE